MLVLDAQSSLLKATSVNICSSRAAEVNTFLTHSPN